MILLLVYTGMRRGELFGLEWKDIDFKNGYLHIVRTSQYIGNKQLITKEPKTKSSKRTMKISNDMLNRLKNLSGMAIGTTIKDW